MEKHAIVSKIRPLGNIDLAPLERIAEIGYKRYEFPGNYYEGTGKRSGLELYERQNYIPKSLAELKPKNGFLAVYRNAKGGIDFLVSYDTDDNQVQTEQAINDSKEIEKRVLRQGILSWPPIFLSKGHMERHGMFYVAGLYATTGMYFWIDYIINKDDSIIYTLVRWISEDPKARINTFVFGMLGAVVVLTYIGTKIMPKVGNLFDKLRVKKMSDNVIKYKFGIEALEGIKAELEEVDREKAIIGLFKSVGGNGNPKQFRNRVLEFVAKYGAIQHLEQ